MKPFYASQLADIRELIISLGLKSIVADGICESLAKSNGILSDEEFDDLPLDNSVNDHVMEMYHK